MIGGEPVGEVGVGLGGRAGAALTPGPSPGGRGEFSFLGSGHGLAAFLACDIYVRTLFYRIPGLCPGQELGQLAHKLMGRDREGRLRPFPPQAVLSPTFTSGAKSGGRQDVRPAYGSPVVMPPTRTPENGRDKVGRKNTTSQKISHREPVLKHGPITACGGNAHQWA
jgi:hypothetical protein